MKHPNAESDFYRLPEFYDILHTPGTAAEVRGLERIARRHCPTAVLPRGRTPAAPTWLEPFCGTARYLRVLSRKGYRVIGIDASAPMIKYGLQRMPGPRADAAHELLCADVCDFSALVRPRSIDFAFCLINSARHLPSDRAMLAHLAQMARVLKRRARYALGLGLACYGAEVPTEDIWQARRGRTTVRQVVQYLPAEEGRQPTDRREQCISHLTVTSPSGSEEIDFAYDLRTYSLKEWTSLLRRSAMEIAGTVNEAGEVIEATEPGYAIFLLKPR